MGRYSSPRMLPSYSFADPCLSLQQWHHHHPHPHTEKEQEDVCIFIYSVEDVHRAVCFSSFQIHPLPPQPHPCEIFNFHNLSPGGPQRTKKRLWNFKIKFCAIKISSSLNFEPMKFQRNSWNIAFHKLTTTASFNPLIKREKDCRNERIAIQARAPISSPSYYRCSTVI